MSIKKIKIPYENLEEFHESGQPFFLLKDSAYDSMFKLAPEGSTKKKIIAAMDEDQFATGFQDLIDKVLDHQGGATAFEALYVKGTSEYLQGKIILIGDPIATLKGVNYF